MLRTVTGGHVWQIQIGKRLQIMNLNRLIKARKKIGLICESGSRGTDRDDLYSVVLAFKKLWNESKEPLT
jgi:hypothetical protein